MLLKWQSWCRLCANYNENILNSKIPIDLNLLQIIEKYLNIQITQHDGSPETICKKCFKYMSHLQKFSDHCFNANIMFNEFLYGRIDSKCDSKLEVSKLRAKFQLNDNDDDSFCDDFKYQILNKIDQTTDTADLNNINKKEIKNTTKLIKETVFIKGESSINIGINEEVSRCRPVTKIMRLRNDSQYNFSENEIIDKVTTCDEDEIKLENSKKNDKSTDEKANRNRSSKRNKEDLSDIFKCDQCNKIFNRQKQFRTHMNIKHGPTDLPYVCSKCPKRFSTEKRVKHHENIHLPDEAKWIHPCPFCDKKFSSATNVKTHVKTTHSDERSFVCDECGKGFKTKGALQGHKLSHTEERPFQCSECPKKFKSIIRLKTHFDVHSESTYPCSICGTVFRTKKSILSHMVVHSDEKRYKCKYCDNKYKRLKDLKCHFMSHTGVRPHGCPFCEKTFANSSNCRTHQRAGHPEEFAIAEAEKAARKAAEVFV